MKKFTKGVVIAGCAMFFAGLLLALVSLALGGNPKMIGNRLDDMGAMRIYRNNYYRLHNFAYNYDYSYDYNFNDDVESDALETPFDEFGEPLKPSTYEITNLSFDFGAGDIQIISGDNFELQYGNDDSRRFFYENISGDTWLIGSQEQNWRWFKPWHVKRDTLKLTVVLPRDFVAESVVVNMGAGNLQIQQLSARELTLDAGVGNCQISHILADTARLSVGVGNLQVRRFHAAESVLEVGMGSVELLMAQPLAQYRCNMEVGLGNVTLGNKSYSGVAELHTGAEDLPYRFDISCGMGSVHVQEATTINI